MYHAQAPDVINLSCKERKTEQAHIPHAPTLLDNAAHHEWQCNA